MTVQFRNARVLRPDRTWATDCPVTFAGGSILSVGEAAPADEIIDLSGRILLPGLVDIHTHGRIGHDFASATADEMRAMRDDYARHGVTSVFPTLASATPLEWETALDRVGDLPCHVTAALELDADGSFAAAARARGATLALGHTNATFAEAQTALARGATCFTHLCNAMPPLHHREGGAVCAALLSDAYAELIVDGMHIAPEMVELLYRAKGPDRFVLITDSMEATGCPDGGHYSIAGEAVVVKNGRAETLDGALAGSTLNLWDGVRNLMKFANVPLADAATCAARNPARAVGIDRFAGSVEAGKRADFLITDESLSLLAVWKNGVRV